MDSIIFFNTGWMDFYDGLAGDPIKGGGKHVENMGWGGEMFNFRTYLKRCYGYVQPKIDRKFNNPSTIRLEQLGAPNKAKKFSGVTVVWTAKDPIKGGTYIVGWYQNATIYRTLQNALLNGNRKFQNKTFGYFVSARTEDVKLLSRDERNVKIYRQRKDWMGQSNVWFANKNPHFVKEVKEYISNGMLPSLTQVKMKSGGRPRQPDILKRIEVEKKAISVVTLYYENLGYLVKSVETDNVGWDLNVTNERNTLKVEVKGLSGSALSTELTPNEYKLLKGNLSSYRICIVTDALTAPKLQIFSFSTDYYKWTDSDGFILRFEDKVGAKISME